MTDSAILPAQRAALVDSSGTTTPEFYRFFRGLSATAQLPARVDDLTVRVAKLEDGYAPGAGSVVGQQSVVPQGILANGVVSLNLQGDITIAPALSFYGALNEGGKGWQTLSENFAKRDNGDGTASLDLADLPDSGTGALLATTFDAKGRKTGSRPATITGTAGRITVANGDASAGLPTIDLAPVADAGGGALLRFVRDAWGRVAGTSSATTADLAEGSNLYFTDARADARIAAAKADANGIASLQGGKLDPGQLPALAITETFVVASQAAMLALVCQQGDVAVRTDLSKSFILTAAPPTTLGNWQELLTPAGGVSSFNGRTGSVVPASGDYTPAQVGAEPAIAPGTVSQYLRGDKTWRDFATDVRAAVLTGLSTATNAVIAATDTVLGALGKLQAQVTGVNSRVDSEQTARADGDAANASAITAVSSRVGNTEQPRPNLLKNPTGANGTDGWTVTGSGTLPAIRYWPDDARGSYLDTTAFSGGSGNYVNVTSELVTGFADGEPCSIAIDIMSDTDINLIALCITSSGTQYPASVIASASALSFVRKSLSFPVPTGTQSVALVIQATAAYSLLAWRSAKIESSAAPTPYSLDAVTQANASAITTLNTTVTNQNDRITANANAIDAVSVRMPGGTGTVATEASVTAVQGQVNASYTLGVDGSNNVTSLVRQSDGASLTLNIKAHQITTDNVYYFVDNRFFISSTGVSYVFGTGGTANVVIPSTDNTASNGTAPNRWSVVYAGTGTINTSDAREKTDVALLSLDELAAAADMSRAIGTYQWLSAVSEKGANGARHHAGLTVQSAIAIMRAHGLDPMRYGFICYDEWPEQPEQRDPKTNAVTQAYRPAGDRYSFRHDELLLFLARGFAARLDALEAK